MLEGRKEAWYQDAEFGRQALAGVNPCALKALTEMPKDLGSAIGPEHVDGATLLAPLNARFLPRAPAPHVHPTDGCTLGENL